MKTYWFGDLRLWKTGQTHEEAGQRRLSMTFDGVDQESALIIGGYGSFVKRLTAMTFFDMHPSLPYTQKGYRALRSAMLDALIERSYRLHPVVYSVEDLLSVQSWSSPTLTTTTDHGLSVGDRVLIRRIGDGLYTYAAVTVVPNTDEIQLSAVTHAIQPGDDVVIVESCWEECRYQNFGPPRGVEKEGDFFGSEASYEFETTSIAWHRSAVDLDA
jgi:hypothetical protein